MSQVAELIVDGKSYQLPIVIGAEGEKAIDIRALRGTTGFITLDNGYMNTASCESRITFIDGERGILRYQGIPVDQLSEQSTFLETAFLLIQGSLPRQDELERFTAMVVDNSVLDDRICQLLGTIPRDAHPMAVFGTMINALACFYPHIDTNSSPEKIELAMARLIGLSATIAAFSYRHSVGQSYMSSSSKFGYSENFLRMMFSSPSTPYAPDKDLIGALEMLLIMHADHEQNCSASAVRLVGSSQPNLYATMATGVAALWGPLHGGANQAVMEMLAEIHQSGEAPSKFIARAKDKSSGIKLAGFGHRVYKDYDPRARIIKDACMAVLRKGAFQDPLLTIAIHLEEQVLADDYFVKRKLYPNVDFYSGLLYKAMGIPTNMFTVLFAIGRMPGWIAQWKEMTSTPGAKIGRPRQIYIGSKKRDYVPLAAR